jgi:Tfp pilus assembly protein PilE
MKSENKHTLMVWAIVVLAVMNFSTLATIVYHHYQTGKTEISQITNQSQMGADSQKFSGRYFRDQLGFSNDQMNKFREFNPTFRQQAHAITIEMAEKRKQMLFEMAADKTDTSKLAILSDSIGMLHSRLKKITFGYYLNIKNMCNTDQQKKLEQLFAEMFTNDAPMGFPGRNGPKGWQQGKK